MGSLYAKDVIAIAKGEVGYTEGSNNWNKYADELDSVDFFTGCGKKQNLAWCSVFTSWCAYKAVKYPDSEQDPDGAKWATHYFLYQSDKCDMAAVVGYAVDYYMQNDAWYTKPQDLERGDQIFFQNSNGYSHTGWCVDWDDNGCYTVEGNAGANTDAVVERFYPYSEFGGRIAGFGRPRYDGWEETSEVKEPNKPKEDSKPEPAPEPTNDIVTVELPVLYKGIDAEGEVLTIQALLNGFGFRDDDGNMLAVDGIFGAKTEQAVRSYQSARGLEVCGVVNAETWNRILK